MSSPSSHRLVALLLAVSALVFLVVGLYLILATGYALIGGVLMATGAADGLLGLYMLGRA